MNQFGHPSSECRAHAISGGKVKEVFRPYTITGTKKRERPFYTTSITPFHIYGNYKTRVERPTQLFQLSHLPLITTSRQVRVNTVLAIGACPRGGSLIYQTCMANSGEMLLRSWNIPLILIFLSTLDEIY